MRKIRGGRGGKEIFGSLPPGSEESLKVGLHRDIDLIGRLDGIKPYVMKFH